MYIPPTKIYPHLLRHHGEIEESGMKTDITRYEVFIMPLSSIADQVGPTKTALAHAGKCGRKGRNEDAPAFIVKLTHRVPKFHLYPTFYSSCLNAMFYISSILSSLPYTLISSAFHSACTWSNRLHVIIIFIEDLH